MQSKSITVGHRAPPTPLESNLPSNSTVSASIAYAESSVDNVVGRRRAPPPPPPRTSSRSPLASPLRAQKSLHSRPLPNLPTSVEANHLAMSLAMKGPLSPQLILNPQRQRRNSSLSSVESKVPTEMQNPSAKADGLQDGLLRTASPTTLSGLVRRASHSASNCTYELHFDCRKFLIFTCFFFPFRLFVINLKKLRLLLVMAFHQFLRNVIP